MQLTKTTVDGKPGWAWTAPTGKRFYLYRSGSCWRYRREDHHVSSVAFATLGEAQRDLARFFEDAHDANL